MFSSGLPIPDHGMRLQTLFRRIFLVCVASAMVNSVWSQTFVHPGCLHTQADLDRMRTNVAANLQSWKSGFDRFAADSHSSPSYAMQGPFSKVDRGTSNLNRAAFEQDGIAAYHQALMLAHHRQSCSPRQGFADSQRLDCHKHSIHREGCPIDRRVGRIQIRECRRDHALQ